MTYYIIDVDADNNLAVWEVTPGNEHKPQPILYQHKANPVVWEATVLYLDDRGLMSR